MYSLVMGNPNLKQAVVQNLDLRYEWYPASGEIISLGAFYKRFKNPIEWTYTDAGGSYIYSFQNALSADLYGLELEVKKDLAFMGLRNFIQRLMDQEQRSLPLGRHRARPPDAGTVSLPGQHRPVLPER